MNDRDAAHLWDMVEACREVQQFLAGKRYSDLLADRMLRLSVERDWHDRLSASVPGSALLCRLSNIVLC